MKFVNGRVVASPTDLANFLTCRHKTALDLRVAAGKLKKPAWVDPLAEILFKRGKDHERRYVEYLRAQGLNVLDLEPPGAAADERPVDERLTATRQALREGVDVIVQGALGNDQWFGYPDILRRTERGYEVIDTKLSRETRGGTILQLCVYTELLGEAQGHPPDRFHVVTPIAPEPYRSTDFGAHYRQLKAGFREFAAAELTKIGDVPSTYPEPVQHCDVCRWSARCDQQRRQDDHLSLVHGLSRLHTMELAKQNISTLTQLASTPLPLTFTPSRGAKETFERLREQARLQLEQRRSGTPTFECLPIVAGFGLALLPEPRPGDVFLDLEGDPFGRPDAGPAPGAGNREYLFGLGRVEPDGSFSYTPRWALNDVEERDQFDATMADIIAALEADPAIHVYHYAPYEATAFKRLMGRYACREGDVDRLLRGRRFVDLYAVVRHAIRAGVESYSIKELEPFYNFERAVDLAKAGDQRRVIEVALETGDTSAITEPVRTAVEGYNRDDVLSTAELRAWLETVRARLAADGAEMARPVAPDDGPSDEVGERQRRVADLRARLLEGVPAERQDRTKDQHARHLLAYLIDWHYREDKVTWWEYFRLLGLDDDDLWDEPAAVTDLEFVERVEVVLNKKTGRPTGSVVDRYRYPPQECEIRSGDELRQRDESAFGKVILSDRAARIMDVKKGKAATDVHPRAAFKYERISPDVPAAALWRLADRVIETGFAQAGAGLDLLRRCPPAVLSTVSRAGLASTTDYAMKVVSRMDGGTLPIQGPPGAGKTFTGARMVCELVAQGRRVGITATSHKVIRNLLDEVGAEATRRGLPIRLGHKPKEAGDASGHVREFEKNDEALTALRLGLIDVLGGTAWLWSAPDFERSVEVLFIDEAGQMSLANALAVSQAAPNLVMLGDPQQLQQPQKGSHPDGVDVSALEHVLGGHETMPPELGVFLPETWRLAPKICEFTSELFYEGKLQSKPGLDQQRLIGSARFDGSGLFLAEVDHSGNRNASTEEADIVASIVSDLLRPGSLWVDEHGAERPLTSSDIRVMAPFNAHITRLRDALSRDGLADVPVGTVDRFQGQTAAVAIYSMATSHPDDAPRGMEFLYSLNRLNVATSRARCASIIVASPRLFEPACATPQRMRLANALSRFREMAQLLSLSSR